MAPTYTLSDLLATPPWEALINVVNHRYVLGLDPNTTRLVAFTPVSGTTTDVTLSASRTSAAWNLLPAFDQQTFGYERLDLATHYPDGTVTLDPTGWTTSADMVDALSNQTGVVFDDRDFTHEELPWVNDDGTVETVPETYQLSAGPWSLRWIGRVVVTLEPNG